MALNTDQQTGRLYKKSLGVADTLPLASRDFFNEPILGNDNVLPNQIWGQSNLIPLVAPSTLPDGGISGVTQRFIKLTLTSVAGATVLSFYHNNLKNAIPFTFGTTPSYNYELFTSTDVSIPFGQGDWLVDTSAGVVRFYGTLPAGVSSGTPPKISFYKYVGTTGFTTLSTDLSTIISTEASSRDSADSSLSTVIYSSDSSLSTMVSSSLSTEISERKSGDTSLSTAVSTAMMSTDVSLSTVITINTTYQSAYSDSIAVASTVGGIVSGTLIGTLTGDTFSDLFDQIFVPTLPPTYATNGISFGGVSPNTVEIGTPYSPSVTATYNQGQIYNGNGSTGPKLTGSGNTYTFKLPNNSVQATYVITTNTTGLTYSSYNVVANSNTWSVAMSYNAGSGLYYDNKNVASSVLNSYRVASSLTEYTSTIVGVRKYFWGTALYPATSANAPANSANVRLLTSGLLNTSNTGSFTLDIIGGSPGHTGAWFYVPNGKTATVIHRETFNNVTGDFVTTTFNVEGANGEVGITYKSYAATIGGTGFSVTQHYDVTIS